MNGYAGRVTSLAETYVLPNYLSFEMAGVSVERFREFEYDAIGRRVVEKWSSATPTDAIRYRYVFDALGNLLLSSEYVNPNSPNIGIKDVNWRERTYDSLNRVRTAKTFALTITYSYDADSRKTNVADPGGNVMTDFDAAGRIKLRRWRTSGQPDYQATYSFKPGTSGSTDLVSAIVYSRADQSYPPVRLDLQYDTLGREFDRKYSQQTSSNVNSTNVREQIVTGYKLGTNLVESENRTGSQTYQNNRTFEYRNTQVTRETNTSIELSADKRVLNYTLDDNGNGVYATAAEASDVSSGNRVKQSGRYFNTYDSSGNIVLQVDNNRFWRMDYDFANRLTRVRQGVAGPGGVTYEQDIAYLYDAEGNLVRRTAKKFATAALNDEYYRAIPLGETTEVTLYAYDGRDVWADLNDSKVVLSRYVRGPQSDQLLARQDPVAVKTYLYVTDRQQTVDGMLDGSGEWRKRILYQCVKAVRRDDFAGGTFHDRWEYTGRPVDFRTRLQNNRARWLDLDAGRWMSEDPLGFAGGDTNLYRYVGGSYANATDPSGLSEWWEYTGPVLMYDIVKASVDQWRLDGKIAANQGRQGPSLAGVLTDNLGTAGGEGLDGLRDGSVIVANQLTFEKIDFLNRESERLIAENGGLYRYSKVMGAIARESLMFAVGGPLLGRGLGLAGGVLGRGGRLLGMSESAISKTSFVARNAFNIAGLPALTAAGAYGVYQDGRGAIEAFRNNDFATGIEKLVMGAFGLVGTAQGLKQIGSNARSALQGPKAWKEAWKNSCFAAGTPLLTASGSKVIEQIVVGDEVLSRDEFDPNGLVRPKVVEEVFERFAAILHVHLGGQVIRTTAEHPFYHEERGWTPAGELTAGDRLLTQDGQRLALEQIVSPGDWEIVYNLRIADFHTYFVGAAGWGWAVWAHNSEYGEGTIRRAQQADLLEQQGMKIVAAKSSGVRNPAVQEAIEKGRSAHSVLQEQMRAKGWKVDRIETGMVDPSTGKMVYPDAITKAGHPVEIKPLTESGVEKGQSQMALYEWITGRRGKVIYYHPEKY